MFLTIGQRVTSGFAIALVLTIGIGLLSFFQIQKLSANVEEIGGRMLPEAILAGEINGLARRSNSLVLNHMLEEDKDRIAKLDKSISETSVQSDATYKQYEELIATTDDRQLFEKLTAARHAWKSERDSVLELSRANKSKEAYVLYCDKLEPAFDTFRDAVNALTAYHKKSGQETAAHAEASAAFASRAIVTGLSVAVLSGVTLAFFIVRGVRKALSAIASILGTGSEQVASASSQVSGSAQSLAQGASEQAAALEETTASLEEMNSMTKRNSDTAQQAATIAGESQTSAKLGNDAMERMSKAIAQIEGAANETAKIVKTIDEIAFQTNLLALNAAVEAARAGEAGKGFAVVAEEVRNLAMRSAEAAKNTSSLIEGSVTSAKNGVSISTEVATRLQEINTATVKVTNLVGEIAAASKEQSVGIQQISQAVGQMDQVTQSSAANAEESAAASEELNAQAEQMRGVVQDLVKLVGGVSQSTASASASARPLPTAAAGSLKLRSNATSTKSEDFSAFSKAA